MFLVPFKNGWTDLAKLFPGNHQKVPIWCFLVVSPIGTFCGFPEWYFSVVSPQEKKGFSGQPVTLAGIFLGDYGYPMGTLKSQTHFKIGDSSL